MTKREFIQVVVRVFGVCLLAAGAWYSLNLLGNIIMLSGNPALSAKSVNVSPVFADLFIRISVLVVAGVYLIKDGSLLFDLLDR